MHELGIAESIAERVRREAEARKVLKVTAVHVTVGGFSHVEPGNLRFCFGAVVKGTELEGCELVVKKLETGARCKGCGKTFTVREGDFRCPGCGKADVDLTGTTN